MGRQLLQRVALNCCRYIIPKMYMEGNLVFGSFYQLICVTGIVLRHSFPETFEMFFFKFLMEGEKFKAFADRVFTGECIDADAVASGSNEFTASQSGQSLFTCLVQ